MGVVYLGTAVVNFLRAAMAVGKVWSRRQGQGIGMGGAASKATQCMSRALVHQAQENGSNFVIRIFW